jgi:DNA helicase-2/ATP-dependent DNA helicase PcrA
MSIFDNLLEEILDDYEIEYRDEYYDRMIHSEDYLRLKQNLEFKNSLEFKKILEKYASKFKPNFKAIYYDNTVVFDKEALEAIFNTYKKTLTLDTRLSLLREEILTEIHKRRPAKLERIKAYVEEHTVRHEQERDAFVRLIMIREGSVLAREIDQALGYDVYDAYQSLLKDHEKLKSLSKGIQIPDQLQIQASQTSQIAYDDASAVCYLKDLLSGNDQYTNIKQVVIDEAQDYYPLQYALLANRFNYSKFTILGDTKQTIARQNEGFFEVLSTIFSSKKSLFVTLTKSFRCTKQILSFTEKFLEGTRAVESFNRDGDEPVIRPTESLDDCLASLSKDIDDCFAAGYNSIGIITKTNQESVHYYDALKEAYHITLATKNSTLNNIVSSSVYMAKGLEFDCVFVMDVDVDHYSGDDDKNLLYIACTRALHRLYLYHEAGKPSALLT